MGGKFTALGGTARRSILPEPGGLTVSCGASPPAQASTVKRRVAVPPGTLHVRPGAMPTALRRHVFSRRQACLLGHAANRTVSRNRPGGLRDVRRNFFVASARSTGSAHSKSTSINNDSCGVDLGRVAATTGKEVRNGTQSQNSATSLWAAPPGVVPGGCDHRGLSGLLQGHGRQVVGGGQDNRAVAWLPAPRTAFPGRRIDLI